MLDMDHDARIPRVPLTAVLRRAVGSSLRHRPLPSTPERITAALCSGEWKTSAQLCAATGCSPGALHQAFWRLRNRGFRIQRRIQRSAYNGSAITYRLESVTAVPVLSRVTLRGRSMCPLCLSYDHLEPSPWGHPSVLVCANPPCGYARTRHVSQQLAERQESAIA